MQKELKTIRLTVTIIGLIVFISGLIFSIDFAPIFADEKPNETITLYPTLSDLEVIQGSTKEIDLFIKNDTNLETSFKIYPAEIDINRYIESNELVLLEDSEISSWIKTPDSITVSPTETANIKCTISVPPNTFQKTYFPVVVFEQLQSNDPESLQVSIEQTNGQAVNAKIITYIYLTVLDSAESRIESLQITSFTTEKQITWERKNKFIVEYKNNGVIISKPRGFIELTVTPGRLILDTDIVINDKFNYMLPQLTRQEELTWQHESVIGSILPLIKINSSAKLFSTDGILVSEKEISFWYIDITKLIFWLLGIIGIFCLLYRLKLARNRKK
ncbi:hypothetical protein JW962_01490 [Candidatus Dojkabacteria bacterium]|nr:hypothetical protein [Candidatus Dojkabacteria bacterium]